MLNIGTNGGLMECKVIKRNTDNAIQYAVKQECLSKIDKIISINILKEGTDYVAWIWYKI
jgi:hypothetical protein